MSDLMLFGVLRMPYEMAMCDELSRYQFYQRAQEAADRLEAVESSQPAPQGVAEVMELVERYAESCSTPNPYGWNVSETPERWDAVNRAVTAIVQERDALKLDKAHHEKVIENVNREAHQWWSALQVATARVAELEMDAARYRWLTADLTGAAKYLRDELLDRLSVMSYSSACTDIDAAIAASKEPSHD